MQIDPPPSLMQRARGRAEVTMSLRAGRTRLDRLWQQGCAKALLPRSYGPVPEVVLINTAGGVTGGDRLDWRLEAGAGASLAATTQAAERVYRSAGGAAMIATRLAAGKGASLEWLPQETIVFDGGRLARRLEVDLHPTSRFSNLETLVLGRAAMGETVRGADITDRWRIRRAGRLVHAEALRLEGDIARASAGPAALAGARAFATFLHAAPEADAGLERASAMLPPPGHVTAAATAKPGLLIARFAAAEPRALRDALIRFLMAFREGPLPRVWSS